MATARDGSLLEVLDAQATLAQARLRERSVAEFPYCRGDDRRSCRQPVFAHTSEFKMIKAIVRYSVFILVAVALGYGGYRMLMPASSKVTPTEKTGQGRALREHYPGRRQGRGFGDRTRESLIRRAARKPFPQRHCPAEPGIAGPGYAPLPGIVRDVRKRIGNAVQKGDVLAVHREQPKPNPVRIKGLVGRNGDRSPDHVGRVTLPSRSPLSWSRICRPYGSISRSIGAISSGSVSVTECSSIQRTAARQSMRKFLSLPGWQQ